MCAFDVELSVRYKTIKFLSSSRDVDSIQASIPGLYDGMQCDPNREFEAFACDRTDVNLRFEALSLRKRLIDVTWTKKVHAMQLSADRNHDSIEWSIPFLEIIMCAAGYAESESSIPLADNDSIGKPIRAKEVGEVTRMEGEQRVNFEQHG
uniref:AlNc14C200G8665 protein n=1 Tax=Albugo laibachii Nc14 TaxID=890382 RepID=F0WQJ5_9STRA|nr:AlNc14C200G8665 [Albugo laibachii Nc14]CCA24161.1 AlNc14C224G9182 [Albugo laibachii Nc14]|eukprot:CCA24161.1 AlNc14C224G9182 [Albugo laibachii Nc14]